MSGLTTRQWRLECRDESCRESFAATGGRARAAAARFTLGSGLGNGRANLEGKTSGGLLAASLNVNVCDEQGLPLPPPPFPLRSARARRGGGFRGVPTLTWPSWNLGS